MNQFVNAIIVLMVAVMLFGCTGSGGNATPTPAPPAFTPTPSATATTLITPQATPIATPIVTPTGMPAQTPTPQATPLPTPTQAAAASPTPVVHVPLLSDLYGCSRVGLNYTYRITTATSTSEIEYATSEGGSVNGVETVLKIAVASTQGMTITLREWDAKSNCRCIKAESFYLNNSIPAQCPDAGVGTASANTTVTLVGEETVSVPAYSGLATRYAVVSTTSNATYVVDVWSTPSIAVPVKMVGEGMTTELVSYRAG